QAPNGSVRIVDSHLETGAPSAVQNFIGLPHDVTLTRTTLVVSPTDENGAELPTLPGTLLVANVRWQLTPNDDLPPLLPAAPAPHALVFDQCTFERGAEVSPATRVYAVGSTPAGGSVTLRDPTLAAGVEAF